MAVVAAIAIALESYVLFIKDFILVWTRPLAALTIAVLGVLAARIAGNLTASAENTKILGYLFHDMDPDRFIKAYGDVASKTAKGSFDSFSCHAYLADGYSASGNPDKAVTVLDKAYDEVKDKDKIMPFYHMNRLRYLLASGRYDEGDEEYSFLMDSVEGRSPAMRANIEKNALPLKAFLDSYLRNSTDCSSLVDAMGYSRILTLRLESAALVQVLSMRKGRRDKEADNLLRSYPRYKVASM